MKFAKHLARAMDVSDPEWSPFWINYKQLKKLLKTGSAHPGAGGNAAAGAVAGHQPGAAATATVGEDPGRLLPGHDGARGGGRALLLCDRRQQLQQGTTPPAVSHLHQQQQKYPEAAGAAGQARPTGSTAPVQVSRSSPVPEGGRRIGDAGAAGALEGEEASVPVPPAQRRDRQQQSEMEPADAGGGIKSATPLEKSAEVGGGGGSGSGSGRGNEQVAGGAPRQGHAREAGRGPDHGPAEDPGPTLGGAAAGAATVPACCGSKGSTCAAAAAASVGARAVQPPARQAAPLDARGGSAAKATATATAAEEGKGRQPWPCECPFFAALLREVRKCRVFFLENEAELKVHSALHYRVNSREKPAPKRYVSSLHRLCETAGLCALNMVATR